MMPEHIDFNASVIYMEQKNGKTEFNVAANPFYLSKSIAFNNEGTEVYVADTFVQRLHVFTWDAEKKELVPKGEPSVFLTKGRMDNMKTIEGTDHVMGGNVESF